MSQNACRRVCDDIVPHAQLSDHLTRVELIWVENRIEYWIRFGREAHVQMVDNSRSVVSFQPNSIFAFVRWAANDYGTIISRIDIVRAVKPGEAYQTLPFVWPGGEILLRIGSWRQVGQVLQAIDAIENLDIEPEAVSPDHWRHVHNRLIAGEAPRAYTHHLHRAFLARRRMQP
jgi:hypothetical protein